MNQFFASQQTPKIDIPSTVTNSQYTTSYSANAGFNNNDDIPMIDVPPCNSNESYITSDTFQQTPEANYLVSNTIIEQDTDFIAQNDFNQAPNTLTLFANPPSTPFYQYKAPIMQANEFNPQLNAFNPQPIEFSAQPSMMAPGPNMMPTNFVNPPNICPITGYEAIPVPSNPNMPCGCAYCINYYQNQWYVNYYPPTSQYMYSPQVASASFQPNDPQKFVQSDLTDKSQQETSPLPQYYYVKPTSNVPCESEAIYNFIPQQSEFITSEQEVDQKLAHLTPIYINQPVPSNTEHFQRRAPFKKRDHNALSWLLLYLELEKDVESPTQNARIAWVNDMHHISYTKLTSGIVSRWQYEFEFTHLKSLITQKSLEADEIFKIYPRLCHCGERCKSEEHLNEHTNYCLELKPPLHRCLCGQLFEKHYDFFQHIFNGLLVCPMAVYHLWIFFEKYRRRRYKCFCTVVFYNFWVYYVHMGECNEYQNYFLRNCYFCNDYNKRSMANLVSSAPKNPPAHSLFFPGPNNSSELTNAAPVGSANVTWNLSMIGPLKDLVRYSKLQ